MAFEIIGYAKDLRTETNILYAQILINDYLQLIGDNFQDFEIQRKREKFNKAYQIMKNDIKAGAVLPTITLALKPKFFSQSLINHIKDKNNKILVEVLSIKNQIFILDGLQRSFILKDLQDEGFVFKNGQKLLVEFWIEPKIENLIYRFVILNAGQKPMSFRHKLDILFYGLKEKLESEFDGLELLTEREGSKRIHAGQFQMRNIATSYHCFLIKNYEPAKENIVVQQMQEEKIAFSDSTISEENYKSFVKYLAAYIALDKKVFDIYDSTESKHFLSNENVMNAFFAAISVYTDTQDSAERIENVRLALEKLQNTNGTDILGWETYQNIKKGIFAFKGNVGLKYKRIIFEGFREFFKNEGKKDMSKCWQFASDNN
jgi:hypothetical protein